MRIIARSTLHDLITDLKGHRDRRAVRTALDLWVAEVSAAQWPDAAALTRQYPTASLTGVDRVVFGIKDGGYRLVTAVDFDRGIVWIRWAGRHRAFDKIDVMEVNHVREPEAHPHRGGPRGGARRAGAAVGRPGRQPRGRPA
ncbi:type II toxin-antitoxin system HigB family toxin [Tistrella mobilis]|uniref:type II toxin-antitoxin system HigB family toxin n=1 Tax=Tistrella mobilis TaxID=171437 RepID=UPI0035593005